MVRNNRIEDGEMQLTDESTSTLKRLDNWHNWQKCLESLGTSYPGRAAFYKVPGGIDLSFDNDDAELVESALTIFIRSWGRAQYRKIKAFMSSTSTAELARRANTTRYLYEAEILGLLNKVQYCIEYVEQNPEKI